ncbi:predicted protein [Naegleria gruberi]|uniref:N-acetylaspartylglutamate synthase n=1 Tax=Naegleria gruberi TaxID=5762 RepID=D2VXM9_NAEGR|nr:uncharacterized protein NAEGRDRAFT_73807 [Naegleria gruberi]EFC38533.1 predicted protein [Naegleria gruberi]|eukprot:XP_002671277.1 predicted protein [Naegleria gruberi strain NEG-M]
MTKEIYTSSSSSSASELSSSREITIPEYALSFQLKPKYISSSSSSSHSKMIIYLNAQDDTLYNSEEHGLQMIKGFGYKKAKLRVWIISTNQELNYTRRRIIEEGWRAGVLVSSKVTGLFSVCADSETDLLQNQVEYDGKIVELPNVIINRCGAKITYCEMALLRFLESFEQCLVLNSSKGMEISKDKLVTMQTLARKRISIPKTIAATFPLTRFEWIEQKLGGYPKVLKKTNGSQGKGIILIKDRNQLQDLNEIISTSNNWILQEFISNSSGKDLRIIVMGDMVVGSMMRKSTNGNFKANFHQGALCEKFPMNEELERLARLTTKECHLDISGVDILLDHENVYKICEINSSPGCEGFEQAHCGEINIGRETIEFCLREHNKRRSNL